MWHVELDFKVIPECSGTSYKNVCFCSIIFLYGFLKGSFRLKAELRGRYRDFSFMLFYHPHKVVHGVTIGERALTHRSPHVCLHWDLFLVGTLCGFGQVFSDVCSQPQCPTEHLPCPTLLCVLW